MDPSQEPGTSSAHSTNEETNVPSPRPEADSSESSNSPGREIATREISRGATSEALASETVQAIEQPRLDSIEALVLDEFQLEDRKIDERDQPPPRQLNHDGIALVPDQNPWPPAGLSELVYTDYNSFAFTDNIEYGLSAADYALLNPVDEIEGTGDWMSSFDLLGYGASLPMGGPERSPAGGPPVDLGLTMAGEEPDTREGKCAEHEESDEFIVIAQPST